MSQRESSMACRPRQAPAVWGAHRHHRRRVRSRANQALCTALLCSLAACEVGETVSRDAAVGPQDGAPAGSELGLDGLPGDGTPPPSDAGPPPPDGPPPTLVQVSSPRELRGVWVASVANIDFPTQQGLSAASQKAELVQILDTMADARFNAIFFQVRPEGDALYDSSLEPWSRYLTGTQGKDPGYDPLAYVIQQAHKRNIEVHAWFNPYRAKANKNSTAVQPHMSLTLSDYAYPYGSYLWMDPGAKAVVDHTEKVIVDVVKRYDVDGVHFDDYFYPYPVSGVSFPDDKTYADYLAGGGTLSKGDWRRDNVNRMVQRISSAVAAQKKHVRFGISPFGIYRPGIPSGISGLDQYASIYADPKLWKEKGWVDYLAPQLYWPSTQTAQAFGTLIQWWAPLPDTARYTFPGLFLSKLGSSSAWTVQEFRTQIQLIRAQSAHNALGHIVFSWVPLGENRSGIVDVFRNELHTEPALTPKLATASGTVAPPTVARQGSQAQLSHPSPGTVRCWTVYSQQGGWTLQQVVPGQTTTIDLQPGTWAIAAVARNGLESKGVQLTVP